jgi:hypothetical protein
VSIRSRLRALERRRDADDGYCPGHPSFFPKPIDWRADLCDLLDPDPEVREAAERRQRAKAAEPCEECGRPKVYIPIRWIEHDEWNGLSAH